MPTAAALNTAQAARWFHALSDETRLDIVERLMDGERCVCELTDDLDAAQSRLSFHLKTLKDADIVTDRKEGRWVHYSLNHETLGQVESVLTLFKRAARSARNGAACCD